MTRRVGGWKKVKIQSTDETADEGSEIETQRRDRHEFEDMSLRQAQQTQRLDISHLVKKQELLTIT